MTAWRQVIELSIGEDDLAKLVSITRSRTEPASRVERARMLLAYRQDPSFFAVGHCLGVHHQTVQRCVERAGHLDNHSAHISKETKAWLASQPAGRFEFPFTPKHGSWLNLVEGFFS